MKDKILGVLPKDSKSTVIALSTKSWDSHADQPYGEWKGENYKHHPHAYSILYVNKNTANFYVYYEGKMDEAKLKHIVDVINQKTKKEGISQTLVYGSGCETFAPFLKQDEHISAELLAHKDFEELGDISKWTRKTQIVVEGTDEYSLGAGTLYLAGPLKCDAEWTKLWLRPLNEVKDYARERGVVIADDEAKSGVSTYGTDDQGLCVKNETAAMYFDHDNNEMMLFTNDVLRNDEFMSRVKMSHGEFILQDDENIDMLQHLPGWTVCIQDQKAIKQFKADFVQADNPDNKYLLAKKFKHFVMKDKILGMLPKDEGIYVNGIHALNSDNWGSWKDVTEDQWDAQYGTFYKSAESECTIIFFDNYFILTCRGGMDARRVEFVDNVMSKKLVDQEIIKALVYHEGCQDMVPYLKPGRCISYELAAHVKELGNISKWSRQSDTPILSSPP
eukprot:GHVS01023621.1.p1 GENE.GHVS01023621.1~~GHVS01023621.1.p1  ORF type:complete len:447 (+),score=29.49 GHVS01023621.1:3-1343(+)